MSGQTDAAYMCISVSTTNDECVKIQICLQIDHKNVLCKRRVLHDDEVGDDDDADESTCVKHNCDICTQCMAFIFVLKLIRKWAHCKTTRWRHSDRPIYSVRNFHSIEFSDNRVCVRERVYIGPYKMI